MKGLKTKHLFIDGIEMKLCSRCKTTRNINDFYISKFTSDGMRSACKECEKKENASNYGKNSEKVIARARVWQAQNPERVKKLDRQRHKSSKRNAWRKKWKLENPEKVKAYSKSSYEKLKAKGYLKAYHKKWREEINRDAYLTIHKKATQKRRSSIKGNLDHRMSVGIYFALKSNKAGRKWESLAGYDLENLIDRLNATMPKGYSWDDYLDGRLHIDHIIPKSFFKYTSAGDDQFKKCWALTNLQLLPAIENIKKGNRVAISQGG